MPMISSRGRKALLILAGTSGILIAHTASAVCNLVDPAFVAQDVQMDMGQVVILPNTAVGAIIKEITVPINERKALGWCNLWGGTSRGEFVNAAQQQPVPGFPNVYQTGVAGVGISVFRDSGRIQEFYPHTVPLRASWKDLIGGQFRVRLIKTAAQTGSGLIAPNGRFTTYYFDGDTAARPQLTSSFRGTGTTVVSPTCEVQAGSRNIAVDFGSVPNSSFNGVGSRAVDRDFEIRLNCQGSNVATFQSNIGVRLDAVQDSSSMPGVLRLDAASNSATRIGIELVQRDGATERELRFGQTINVGPTTPGISVLTLPLRARYVQTQAGAVGAGVANGQATFTVQYE